MDVFTLAVEEFSDNAVSKEPSHLLVVDHVRVVFRKHIDESRSLDGSYECDTLGECTTGTTFAHNVLSRFESPNGKRCMLMIVVRKHHGIEIVL